MEINKNRKEIYVCMAWTTRTQTLDALHTCRNVLLIYLNGDVDLSVFKIIITRIIGIFNITVMFS